MFFSIPSILRYIFYASISNFEFPSSHPNFRAQYQLPLRLSAHNEFTIAVFSDLHYGEEEHGWGILQDIKSTNVTSHILDYEKPDFVVLNGDLITGENTLLENATKYIDVLVQPMVKRGVRWASTYGNHDSQYNLSRERLFEEESKFVLSYTQNSLALPGVTNYYLPIYPFTSAAKRRSDEKPVAILWFFDSRGGFPFQKHASALREGEDVEMVEEVPHFVAPEVVTWFQVTRNDLVSRYGVLPSLAFVHIPPTPFLDIQNAILPVAGAMNPHFPGLNADVPVDSQGAEDGDFVKALRETEGLKAVFSGHDHGDSWCVNWVENGPRLCFCKHTGYGGYGTWKRGSRVLRMSFGEDRKLGERGEALRNVELESWVRMEGGKIVQRVGLNESYGTDIYPFEDGEED